MSTELKECKICQVTQPLQQFGVFTQRNKTYHRGQCNDCRADYERKRRVVQGDYVRELERKQYQKKKEEDPEGVAYYYRDWHLRKKYNLTLDEFEDRAALVDYKCEICGSEEQTHKNLVVDHNHNTGEVRGLLCSSCNQGLGHFKDSPYVLKKALDYLQERGDYGD